MKRNHKLVINCCGKMVFVSLLLFMLHCFLGFSDVHALNSEITLELEESAINLLVTPGQFESVTIPITINATNVDGYSLIMQTGDETTDLMPAQMNGPIISTITLPAGQSSVSKYSIQNGYAYSSDGVNFKPVPSVFANGDIVADVNEVTKNISRTHEITLGAEVSMLTTPGEYTKTFIFTAIANITYICDSESICYYENDGDDGGGMKNQAAKSKSDVTLSAPKFSREGYGFAGWNTRKDGTGTNYGPNQTINVGDLSSSGLTLFANWVESRGELQNWDGCSTLSVGDVIALTDSRDNNTYAVAKLADGACWMVENLRLDLSNPNLVIDSKNTNNPTDKFSAAVTEHPSSSSSFCTTNTAKCVNQIAFNASGVDPKSADFWYSYGVYYNWYTATAGNGLSSDSDPTKRVAGDLCPAGWKLPDGYGINGNLAMLDIALGGSGNNATSVAASNSWRSYPNNFLYSGQQNGNSITTRGETGNYHGANVTSANNSGNLWLQTNKVSTNTNGSNKTRGQTIRCLMQEYYQIHFDSNATVPVEGSMSDQTAALNNDVKLYKNSFSVSPQKDYIYTFRGWNTKADGTGDSYNDEDKVKNLTAANKTITLYAQWDIMESADVTVIFSDDAISEISFYNSERGDKQTVKSSGEVVSIMSSMPYTVSIDLDTSYDFEGWETTENGTLSSTTASPMSYIVTESATLTAITKHRETKLYLQDLNPAVCSSTPKVAYDIRDGEAYHIRRLNDGNCWLLDDLRLGASPLVEPLSNSNTNMPEGAELTFVEPDAISKYHNPEIYTGKSGTSVTNYGAGDGKVGVYYNFCAASAGTICSTNNPNNAVYDICPAGWRLPTGGQKGEYAQALATYDNSVGKLNADLSTALTGWYYSDAVKFSDFNSAAVFWTSTASNSTNKVYMVRLGGNSITYTTGYLEDNGLSIRCLLK